MSSPCERCPGYSKCNGPCPEVNAIIDEEEVKQKEMTIGVPIYGRQIIPLKPKVKLTFRQSQIIQMLLIGEQSSNICKTLEITKQSYQKLISRINQKL